jgi:hypothetical protein
MKIPKTVTIDSLEYAVHIEERSHLDTKYDGIIEYAQQKIFLIASADGYMAQTFLHECIHGMLHALGYEDHDEKLINGLSCQLYRLIKDNPELFKDETDDKA